MTDREAPAVARKPAAAGVDFFAWDATSMKRLTRLTLVALWMTIAPAAIVMSFPALAAAQGNAAKYEQKLKSAISDYDMLMIGEARKTLEDAVAQAEREGVSGLAVAKLYIMLGIVRFAQSRDQADAKAAFVSALEHDYGVDLPAVYTNPKLAEALNQARAEVEPPPKEPKPTESAQNSTGSTGVSGSNTSQAVGFRHDAVRTATAGQPVAINIAMPADMPVYHVYVYHRRFGESDFERVEMRATGATGFTVEIPGEKVNTSQVEYYIQALDRAGAVIGHAGSEVSPLTMTVLGSSDAIGDPGGAGDDEETGDEAGGDVELPAPASDQKFYVMLTGGTGLGFVFGGEPTGHPDRDVSPGLAPAFGHAMLDAGYMITPNAHIGLYFRWQFSPPQDFDQVPDESKTPGSIFDTREECLGLGLPGDCLLGAKYRYFFTDLSSARMYSSIGAGIGRVRHWLRLKEPYYQSDQQTPTVECSGKDRIEGSVADYCHVRDTVRPGWVHVGFGAGLMWPVQEHIDLVADTYLIVLLPETGLNLDLSLGVNFRF
jgi:hypothetical protein